MTIDAHLHLWDKQLGRVGENKVVALTDGKSDFGGEIRQMMPHSKASESAAQTSSGRTVTIVAALDRSRPSTIKSTVFSAAP